MSLSCSAVRLMPPLAVVEATDPLRIAEKTSELIVLSAMVAAMDRAPLLLSPPAAETAPPIVYALMVVSDLVESDISPAELTRAASAYACTRLVISFSDCDTPIDAAAPLPPNEPAMATAPATAVIVDVSVADIVSGPPLAAT